MTIKRKGGTELTISEKGLRLAEERRFWQDMEDVSRPFRDKKVHAYAVKMVKWIGKVMLEVARDQMEEDADDEMSEEELKKRLLEEDKKSPSEKIGDDAIMNAFLEAQFGSSPI